MLMENTKDIFHKDVKKEIWKNSIALSFLLFFLLYISSGLMDGDFSIYNISKALAGTGALLLAASFSLSGFCYYWDFLDTKIAYRKYLGLVAFYWMLAYSLSLAFLYSDIYIFGFWENISSWDMILGITSMLIFFMLVVISRDSMMIKIGPKKWRKLMRLGYLAWLLLAIRAYLIEKDLWHSYMESMEGFPPPRILLSLLVIAVILFRLSIDFSKKCIIPLTKKIKQKNNEGQIKT